MWRWRAQIATNRGAPGREVSDYGVHAARSVFTLLMLAGTACGGGHVDPGFYKATEWKDPAADQRAIHSDETASPIFARPKLVVIRADWCPFCTRAEPAVEAACEQFRGRVDLVVLDVTDEKTSEEAERVARQEGVEVFFRAYRGRTPTMGIFVAPGEGRRVHGNNRRAAAG